MGKKIREKLLRHHKDGYDFVALYGTTRNIQRTSFFYKEGNLRKTIDFIYPKQKTWTPIKVVTLYNSNEEVHCDDGPARIVKCLEHRTLIAEEYFHKGVEIFEEGFQLLQKMLILQRNKHLMPEEKIEDDELGETENNVIE